MLFIAILKVAKSPKKITLVPSPKKYANSLFCESLGG
jgi:hypothetical protein